MPSGLADLASSLGVARIGQSHQSGSDSLLTGQVFFKIREVYICNVYLLNSLTNLCILSFLQMFFKNSIDEVLYNGRVYGLSGHYYSEDTVDAVLPDRIVEATGGKKKDGDQEATLDKVKSLPVLEGQEEPEESEESEELEELEESSDSSDSW